MSLSVDLGGVALGRVAFAVQQLFTFGTSVGGAHWFTDPNTLYRRRNRLTYTGFSGATSGTPGTAPTGGWVFGSSGGSQTVSGGSVTFTVAGLARQFFYTPTAAATLAAGESAVFTVTVEAVSITAGSPVVAYLAVTSGSASAQTYVQASQGAGRHTCYVTAGSAGCTVEARLGVGVSSTATGTVTVKDPQVETRTLTATEYQAVPTTWAQAYLDAVGAENIFAWQDSAGTTPVTAAGDTIGLSLDRAYGGYRGAEVLTNGGFDSDTTWAKSPGWTISGGEATFTANSTNAAIYQVTTANPGTKAFIVTYDVVSNTLNGGLLRMGGFGGNSFFGSAITLDATVGRGKQRFFYGAGSGTATLPDFWVTNLATSGSIVLDNISIREIPGTHLIQATGTARPTLSARVNLLLNTATMSTQNVTTLAASYRLRFEGTGTVTLSGTATAGPLSAGTHSVTATAGTLTLTVSGSVTSADFRTSDDAAKNIPVYQRVGATAADHDTDGFPHYALFDGTDDSWASAATVDGSGSDKVTVVAGVTKNSDAASGCVVEHTATSASNNGAFILSAPTSASVYQWRSKGTAQSDAATAASYPAPSSVVLTGTGDIGADVSTLRIAGAQVASAATDQGTGNYANATTYVGSRAGSSLRFNGRIYSLVFRFGAMGEADRNRSEQWNKNLMRLP